MIKQQNRSTEIWVLIDDKAGHKNQVMGVADAIGLPISVKKLVYNKNASKPNFFLGASLKGIDIEKSDELQPTKKDLLPDLIIAAGRKTAPVARFLKNQTKKVADRDCFIAQIMYPSFPSSGIDLIAIPEHDNIKEKKNIITTIGAPHRVTQEFLEREGAMWGKTLGTPKRPLISLLIGGGTEKIKFNISHAEELLNSSINLAKQLGGTLWITNSRRTDAEINKLIVEKIKSTPDFFGFFYDCNKERANPYYALLALADMIIVTGDSISMCSEACAAGRPLIIYAPDDIMPKKHKRMHQALYKEGYAAKFDKDIMSKLVDIGQLSQAKGNAPLDASQKIANKIREMVG